MQFLPVASGLSTDWNTPEDISPFSMVCLRQSASFLLHTGNGHDWSRRKRNGALEYKEKPGYGRMRRMID
jgi:hypothetical protein